MGNRTLCHSIWSVIKQVIKQIRLGYTVIRYLLITPLITDRNGLHSVLLPLQNYII